MKLRTSTVTTVAALLALSCWASPDAAHASTSPWSGPVQTSVPLAGDIGAAVAAFGHGLVETYTSGRGLVLRRMAGPAPWGTPLRLTTAQVPPEFDTPAIAASESDAFVVSEAGTDPERLTLHVVPLDQSADQTHDLGIGAQPYVAALLGGGAVVVATRYDSSGTSLGEAAWTVSQDGVLTGPTSLSLSTGDRASALVLDSAGTPEVFSSHCTSNCDPSVGIPALYSIQVSTMTTTGSWSTPTSVVNDIDPIYLSAATGKDLTLLTWLDGTTTQRIPTAVEQRAGIWSAPETTPSGGEALIASDGTEVISDDYGAVSTRAPGGGPWTAAPTGPNPGVYCDGGDQPALRDNVLYVTSSVPDPVAADSCVLIETRLPVATATWSASYPDRDAVDPSVSITSGPAPATTSTSATFTFTVTDNSPGPVLSCRLDGKAVSTCSSPLTVTGLASGPHQLLVIGRDSDGNYGGAVRSWTLDRTAPSTSVTSPAKAVTLTSSLPVTWRGSDSGGSGVATFDVRYERASASGTFGGWAYPSGWQATTRTSTSLTKLVAGATYCFSDRARDHAGNTSAWSSPRCTTVPLDDRALAASSGWSRTTGSGYYRGTISTTTHTAATLKSPSLQVQHLYLVATRCRRCGTVGLYAGPTLVAKISLSATATSLQAVLPLPRITLRTCMITIKSLGTAPVHLDGLATTRL